MAVVVRQCEKVDNFAVNGSPANSKIMTTDYCFHIFCCSQLTWINFALPLLHIDPAKDVKIDVDGDKPPLEKSLKTKRSLQKWKSFPNSGNNSFKGSRSKKWTKDMYSDILQIDGSPLPKLPEEEEAVGIITMEDVIEELLQVYCTQVLFIVNYNMIVFFFYWQFGINLTAIFSVMQEEIFDETDHHFEDS